MKGYTNIALFGVDSREENLDSSNSDTTIVASINKDTKEVKLVSIYRDTYLNIGQDKDKYDKANAAYAIGGPVQAMSMLNTNMDLNIKNYVAVDFSALVKVIDLLGGLDVDLSLDSIGGHKMRSGKEEHLYNARTIHLLQESTKRGDYEMFKEYSHNINEETRLMNLRGLLEFKFDEEGGIPIEEVESVDEIVKRF